MAKTSSIQRNLKRIKLANKLLKKRQELKKIIKNKKLPLEELKDRISMLGTDLENIENNEIQVEIFPNRPDMLSEQGFARAFSSFIGVKTGLKDYKIIICGESYEDESIYTDMISKFSKNNEIIRKLKI